MKMHFIIILLIFLSCTHRENNIQPGAIPKQQNAGITKTDLENCKPADTVLKNNTAVRYLIVDSFFVIKVVINDHDTVLDYQFNCQAAPVLVPTFYAAYKDIVCLKHGYGQHFREFVICYTDGNKIVTNTYETALATDLKKGIVIYRDYDSPGNIYIGQIRSKQKKTIQLPAAFVYISITSATLTDQELNLIFYNGKKLNIAIP